MTKAALGRGFEDLIPIGMDISAVSSPGEQIKYISLERIVANPDQPRREFDQKALEELAESIKEHGIIQPLVVTPIGENFRIVAGERRYRASKIADLSKIPVIVRNHEELKELEVALVENVQRVDLSPLEQAVSILRLRDQFSLTPKQIAKKLGKAETTISNIVRLLQLPKVVIDALQKQQITEGHARAILSLKFDQKLQVELLGQILDKKLSVRDTEELVKQQKIRLEQKNSSIGNELKKKITEINKSGFDIKVQEKKKGGVLLLPFKTEQELRKILDKF